MNFTIFWDLCRHNVVHVVVEEATVAAPALNREFSELKTGNYLRKRAVKRPEI